MRRMARAALVIAACSATSLLLYTPRASAVPSYTRQFGISCTGCHTMWGSLSVAGATFRLSGYRAMNGRDLTPTEKPIELANGALTIPGSIPASIITGAGVEYRREERAAATATDTIARSGANLTVMDASIFLTGPLGKHLSFFIEFPMFESKAWEFTPTGPGEANDRTRGSLQFATESPVFEVAKFWWNSLLGDAAPRDSVNLLAGITHLPLAYPSGKVRLAVNQYLVFERRGLDYISPRRVSDLFASETADRIFRLGEPQGLLEVNGMIVPDAAVTDVGKRETFWLEYHLGVSNTSNAKSAASESKGVYARYVMRWYNQSLGGFAFYANDIFDDALRTEGATGGVLSGRQVKNSTLRAGPDMTLSLAPLGVPVNLENAVLYNREGDPTGFGKVFVWWGGFHQLNWFISKRAVTYARYDWISGNAYDDTLVGGITKADPREWDVIAGVQFLVLENLKTILEYRHHEFEDRAGVPREATLTDDGFTLRAMVGF
jgi:opacity protein-like surface antigen